MNFSKIFETFKHNSQPIDYIKIIPSYKCDKACPYCYNQYLHQDSSERPDKIFVTLEAFLKNQKVPFVAEVIGGEPLHIETIDTTISVLEILTNSLFCKKRVLSTAVGVLKTLQRVLDLLDFVYLSTDISPSAMNRKKRSFHQLSCISSLFANERVELSLAVVLYGDEKEKDLEKIILFAKDLHIKNIGFGYINFQHLSSAEVWNYSKLFHFLFILKYALSNDIFLGGDVLETLDLAVQGIKRQKICDCGESSLVIQPDGNVSPSICLEYKPDSFLRYADFIQMKLERWCALENSSCSNCELWPACRGGCMGASISLYQNHLYRDEVFCSIVRHSWDLIKKDLESVESIYSKVDNSTCHVTNFAD